MSPYLLLIPSGLTFLLMGIDKAKAKAGAYRIPEATLWTFAILGGAPGAYLGMMFFRHKTQHKSFTIGFTLLAAIQLTLYLYLLH